MAQERIEIIVTERGAYGVAKSISAIGDASEKSIIQTNRLRTALTALTGALGINVLKTTLDTYTNMTNRLRTVTNSTGQLKVVQKELFDIAERSRSSFETVTELYTRMAFATKQVGLSQETLLRTTESLNKAITISGASSIEAKAALIQLSQGLASGKLQGDELRSVLEQMPIVAMAISDHMGIAYGDIRKAAKEGKITTEIIVEAISKAGGKWDELFAKLPPTIEGAMTVVKNQFMQTVGAMDEALGISQAFAKGILWLGKNMQTVVGIVGMLATAIGFTLARYALDIAIGRLLDFLKLMVVGPLLNFIGGIRMLGAAFLGFGVQVGMATKAVTLFAASSIFAGAGLFGRLITNIGGAITAFRTLGLAGVLSMATLGGAAKAGATAMLALLNPVGLIRGAFTGLAALVSGTFAAAFRVAAVSVTGLFTILGAAASVFGGIIKIVATLLVGMYALGDGVKVAGSDIITYRDVAMAAWNQIKQALGALSNFFKETWAKITGYSRDAFKDSNKGFFDYLRDIAKGMDMVVAGMQASYDTILSTWKSFPAALADLIWQGLKKLWDMLGEFITRAAAFLKDFFYKIVTLDFDNISAGGLDMQVEGAAQRVADTWLDHFKNRTKDMNFFSEQINQLEQGATKIALEEAEKRKIAAKEEAEAKLKLGEKGPKLPGSPDDEDGVRKRKGFAEYLAELQRERELGLLVGDALKIANEQREIANKLGKDLTETQKSQVAEVVRANLEMERQRNLLQEIKGPTEEYNLQVTSLNSLYQSGAITLDEFNAKFYQLRENFLAGLPEATTFADGFAIQIQKMQMATRNGFGQMGTEVAKIFGPGGTLINGIGDAVAQSIVFGKSFKEQIRQIAQQILSQLIGALVKMGLNMVMNAALNSALGTAATAQGTLQAGALATAYAPAAAMSSLATGGANSAGAMGGITSVFTMLTSLMGAFAGGFKEGGYTGAVGTSDVAGVVHGQEFVINASATKRHRSLLVALNAGKDPVAPIVQAAQAPSLSVSVTNEIPDAAYEVRQYSETDIEIIAKRVVRRETPEIVANDLRNPNSRVSKGVSTNTQAARRR